MIKIKHAFFVFIVLLTIGIGIKSQRHAVALSQPASLLSHPEIQDDPSADNADTSSDDYCDELQIVFLVDQSGSMGGWTDIETGRSYPATDPNGFRFEAPITAVERLGAYHYIRYKDKTIKFAVIYFGDRVITKIPWTDIDPQDLSEFEQFQKDIRPEFEFNDSLGETLFQAPFENASSLFLTPQADGCPARAIIVITDGQPYSSSQENFSVGNHLAGLDNYVNNYMPTPDHRIYVLSVDQNNSYWKNVKTDWEEIVGNPDHAYRAQNQQEMSSLVLEITRGLVEETLGPGIISGCMDEDGYLDVPGSMQQMYVTFTKWDNDVHLKVEEPDGNVIDMSGNDDPPRIVFSGTDKSIETLSVQNPQGGRWKVLSDIPDEFKGDICVISFDAIVAEIHSIEPSQGQEVIQFREMPLQFNLTDEQGTPLPNHENKYYDLDMDVLIRNDTGVSGLTIGADPGEAYIFSDFIPLEAGNNQLEVTATTRNHAGETFFILEDELVVDFNVLPVTFELRESPSSGIRLEQYAEFPLEFALVAEGTPITLSLPAEITATITHVDSGETDSLLLSQNQDHVYQTTYKPVKDGDYRLAYGAVIDTPDGLQQITNEQVTWSISPVSRMHVEFTSPEEMVATDPFLRKTGIGMQLQLVDENSVPTTPNAIGFTDPNNVFTVKVYDADGNEVSGQALTQKGAGYHLRNNDLGVGDYRIVVESVGTPEKGYAWEQTSWETGVTGRINPLFYTYSILAALTLVLIVLFILSQIQIRRHPFSGTIQFYVLEPTSEGESYKKILDTISLPRLNRKTFRPNVVEIKQMKVSSKNKKDSEAKKVTVKIQHKGGKKWKTLSLVPNNAQSPRSSYMIVKDPEITSVYSGGDPIDEPDW